MGGNATEFPIEITAENKVARGARAAKAELERLGKPMGKIADAVGGLGNIPGLKKFTGSLGSIGSKASSALEGIAGAAEAAGMMGAVAAGAAVGVGLLVAAYAGATTFALKFAGATATAGTEVLRTSRGLGIAARDLQLFRSGAEYGGVGAEAMTQSLHGLGDTLNDAQFGRNPMALMMLGRLGLHLRKTKDGLVDTKAMMLDLADVISRQKTPQAQELIAQQFGVTGALPWLRQGRAGVMKDMTRAMQAAGVATDAQLKKDEEYQRRTVELSQKWGKLKRQIGESLMPFAEWNLDRAFEFMDGLEMMPGAIAKAWAPIGKFFKDLWDGVASFFASAWDKIKPIVDKVVAAADRLPGGRTTAGAVVGGVVGFVAGGPVGAVAGATAGAAMARSSSPTAATAATGSGWEQFAGAIERRESRGHQFDRNGNPLTSPRGAIGVMQVLPETGQRAARRGGLGWDDHKFRYDAAYNRQVGRLELQRLLKKYDGNTYLAAAAYNAGDGWVDGFRDKKGVWHDGWLKRFGDPRKGGVSDDAWAEKIPFKETREYVQDTAGRVHVQIDLKGAPAGTKVSSNATGAVSHGVNVGSTYAGVAAGA